jgi:regulator of sirC expression with transglutaminase-like and TPR domain
MGNPAAARNDLDRYLLLAPEAADRAEIEKRLRSVKNYQAGLN